MRCRLDPRPKREHTQSSLWEDLVSLGVQLSDVLFVHSSYKSLGEVSGGAEAVVAALEEAVGAQGLLLMPSFNLVGDRDQRAESWSLQHTPSSVGWLTEFFRQRSDTYRSDHYSHSVSAKGPGAETFVSGHRSRLGYVSPWDRDPWGKTYGADTPMIRAYDRDGKILMIGVDYNTCTFMHVVEVKYWNERLAKDPDAPFVWLDRERMSHVWDSTGRLSEGHIGDAVCKLIGIRSLVDGLLEIVRADPDSYDRVKLKTRPA